MAGSLQVGVVMAVHKFGQEPTIADVCKPCNSGFLSQLDEAAKDWWVDSRQATVPRIERGQASLARWLGKVVYNVQRIEARERGAAGGPLVSESMRAWIRCRAVPGDVAVWASVFPTDHDGAIHGGVAGTDDRPDRPVWLVGLHRFFFCVAWDHPDAGFAREVCNASCQSLPAVSLDLSDEHRSVDVPTLRDADSVFQALYRGIDQGEVARRLSGG